MRGLVGFLGGVEGTGDELFGGYGRYQLTEKLWRKLVLVPALLRLWGPRTIYDLVRGKPFETRRYYAEHSVRGMSAWRDVVDWVGGYPFEVAKPEDIFDFFHNRKFDLRRLRTCGGGLGCNEFVFQKS